MKNAIRGAGFVLALVLAISYAYHVVSWKDTTGDYLSSVEQLYSTPKDLVDVVFMGSSHTYCAINPSILWEDQGIAAFDMSTSGQDRNATYHYLKELLKTQSPQVVFIDMYGLLFDRHAIEGNVYRNLLSMRYSKNAIDIVNGYIEEGERLDYYLRWPIVHTRYKELKMYDFIKYPVSVYGRGEALAWTKTDMFEYEGAAFIDEVGELDEENAKWLSDLKALSEEENFTLVFFVAPFDVKEEEQLVLNAAKAYADENGIAFYDLNRLDKEIGLDRYADMTDPHHTNAFGAEKVTKYFEDILVSEFDLKDHSGDAKYSYWDKDLKYNKHLSAADVIKNTTDVYDCIELATELDDTIVVLSLDGEFENIIPNLARLGISEEEAVTGGKWVYQNGAWAKMVENLPGQIKAIEIDRYHTLIIQYVEGNTQANILLDKESAVTTSNGLNIVVYDGFTNELVTKRGVDN